MASDQNPPIRRDIIIPKPPRRDMQPSGQRIPQRVQPPAQYSEADPLPVNRRKWHLDEDTGEYLRIKHRRGDRLIVDPTPYGQRWMESVLAEHELAKLGWLTLGFIFGGGVMWTIAESTEKPDCVIPYSLAIVFFMTSVRTIFELFVLLVPELFRDLGPEPVSQRPRREQAEQQRVHGAGRFMNREEINRAASGETAFPDGGQRYED